MTARFQKIDDQNRGDHFNLRPDDECFYLYEYTSGHNYSFSATNSLISNLKKKPSLAHTAQYKYKLRDIKACGVALGQAINAAWLAGATLVPVPPSKARTDPEYDDRVLQICKAIPSQQPLDIRDLVEQSQSTQAAHESVKRPTVEDLLAIYSVSAKLSSPAPTRIGIVDDVLTVGTHFRAMKTVLQNAFPAAQIVGFFIARRVIPNPFEAITDDVFE